MSPMTSLTKMMLQGQEPEQDDDEQMGAEANNDDASSGPDDADAATGDATPSNNDLIQAVGLKYGPEMVNLRNAVDQTKSQLQAKQLAYVGKCAEAIQKCNYDPRAAGAVFGHLASQPEFAEHVGLIHEALQQDPSALKPIVDEVADAAAKGDGSGQEDGADAGAAQEQGDNDQDTGGSNTTLGLTDRQKANQAAAADDDDDGKPPVDASGLVGMVPGASQSNAQSDAIGNIVQSMKPGALQQATAMSSEPAPKFVRPSNVEAERQLAVQRGQATQPPVTDAQRKDGLVIRVGIRRLKAGPVGHHTYLEIPRLDQDGHPVYDSNGNVAYDSYGVLGQWDDQKQDGTTDNQQVIKNDIHVKGKGLELRNEPIDGSDNNVLYEIAVTPDQLAQLKAGAEHWSQWRETGDQCPSCGKNYRRGDGALGYQPGYNSNTWVYNMLIHNPAGRIEPPAEITKKTRENRLDIFAPGWGVNDSSKDYYPARRRVQPDKAWP